MSTLPDPTTQRLADMEADRDNWRFTAQQLQKQVNGWKPERRALKAALRELCFAANNAPPLVDTESRLVAAARLEGALRAAEKLL